MEGQLHVCLEGAAQAHAVGTHEVGQEGLEPHGQRILRRLVHVGKREQLLQVHRCGTSVVQEEGGVSCEGGRWRRRRLAGSRRRRRSVGAGAGPHQRE